MGLRISSSVQIITTVNLLLRIQRAPHCIGIEENFFTAPIEGHQLRFDLDDTPVGHFKPWNTDCVLGPGYDYTGTVSFNETGSNTIRTVQFLSHLCLPRSPRLLQVTLARLGILLILIQLTFNRKAIIVTITAG